MFFQRIAKLVVAKAKRGGGGFLIETGGFQRRG
jgi:hypothetical protein